MKEKKIILVVVTGVMLVPLVWSILGGAQASENQSENLLLNPDFEVLDGPDRPKSWSRGAGWSVDAEEPSEGKNSMRASQAWSWLSQEISAEPERYYSFTAYVKSDIKEDKNTFLWLDYVDKKGKVIKKDYGVIYAFSSWWRYGRVILTPAKTEKIRVKLSKRLGKGSVWFDGVKLKPLSNNLLLNPDFETLRPLGGPEFWDTTPGWSVDTREPYRGKNCMQGTVPWNYLWQMIPARPKSFFILRSHLRSDIATDGKAEDRNSVISVLCLDAGQAVIKKEVRVEVIPSSWRENEVAIYTPAGTTALKIMLAKRLGEGSLWVDDLQMRQLPSYLRIRMLRAILDDKPFFIFYFSVYLILLISLMRVVLKR